MGTLRMRRLIVLLVVWSVGTEVCAALRIEGLEPCEPWRAYKPQVWCMQVTGMGRELPTVVLNGSALATGSVTRMLDSLRFRLNQRQSVSGPIWLAADGQTSNGVWLTMGQSRVVAAGQYPQIRLNDRVVTALDLVSLVFREDLDGLIQAQRVARQYGLEIVGAIPPLNVYQVRLPVNSLEGRDILLATLGREAAIEGVVVEDDNLEMPADPLRAIDPPDQQGWIANRFLQAVDLYTDYAVKAAQAHKLHTLLVGVIESGVNFDAGDFASYLVPCDSGQVCLYARHSRAATHGTAVSGYLAAGAHPSANLGFLSRMGAAGGFRVIVDRGARAGVAARVAASVNLVQDGVRVLNWSWGVHRMGGINQRGEPIQANVRSDLAFNGYATLLKRFFAWLARNHPAVVVINSAGNSASLTDQHLPASLLADQLIVVGAHQRTGRDVDVEDAGFVASRASSNVGQRVDITAAGCPPWASSARAEPGGCGTSYAAALVTGAVAAMLSIDPELEPRQVRTLLRQSALPLASGGTVDITLPLTSEERSIAGDSATGQSARLNMQGALELVIVRRAAASVAGAQAPVSR
ncbi:S8/S53 family peptidase [Pseudomonas rubra]|uniref:S8/S53 family peptidase n=1 Tax=Pseudomonas rubra TaxID=2942627 RepID=A0ABT5PFH9_9PSED|nr:S8/S53 family peptidase [Pseudomonas rubra]MDD1017071.1 S8/S53 family peptidase [Pseudomonas rubra]MDD1036648.1 S8/S53 family peptidase [Pseudomonas rubra]MDD1156010.1 S8/S53 family peptidase [Pseudomonas rubra]